MLVLVLLLVVSSHVKLIVDVPSYLFVVLFFGLGIQRANIFFNSDSYCDDFGRDGVFGGVAPRGYVHFTDVMFSAAFGEGRAAARCYGSTRMCRGFELSAGKSARVFPSVLREVFCYDFICRHIWQSWSGNLARTLLVDTRIHDVVHVKRPCDTSQTPKNHVFAGPQIVYIFITSFEICSS